MKINIAICDDDIKIAHDIERNIVKIMEKKGIRLSVDVFFSCEQLCRELDVVAYDLLFLDIEFKKMNGIEVGNYIRNIKNNNIVQIVYISSKQEYAMELFDVRPINFLIKPIHEDEVEKMIETYIKLYGEKHNLFKYKKGSNIYHAEVSNIKYFIRSGRKVNIYLTDGMEEFYDSLENIYEQLKEYRFLFIHKSFLINYDYIKKIGYDRVVMTDGEEFSISQSRRKEIRELYMKMEMD